MPEFNMCEILSEATKLTPRARESAFLYSRRLIKELAADEFPADDWDTLPDEAQQWVNQQIRATNENKQVEEVPGFEAYMDRTQRFNKAGNGEEVKPPQRVQRVRAVAPAPPPAEEPEEDEEEPAPPPPRRVARGAAMEPPAPTPRTRAKPTAVVEEPDELDEPDEPVVDYEEDDEPVVAKSKAKEKAPKEPKGQREYQTRKRPDGKPSAIIRIKEYLIDDRTLTPVQLMERLTDEGYAVSQTTVISCKADFRATLALLQTKGLLRHQML